MRRTEKIAISLPREDFEAVERVRKKMGFERSAVIDKAIRFWLNSLEQKEFVQRYIEGYRKKPEDIQELIAMEVAAAEAVEEENL